MSDCAPSSTSILRRERLSMITTSWPASERCSAVGQPQKPSPPSTKTFFGLLSPPLALCDAGIAISALCCGAATIDGSPARWSTSQVRGGGGTAAAGAIAGAPRLTGEYGRTW